MNATITRLAARALFGQRRVWALLALPLVLVGLAVLVRVLTGSDVGYPLVTELGLPLVTPLVALLAASAVLGPEMDDGSIVYLLAKPVNRHTVAFSKWVVAWLGTLVAGAVPVLVAGVVLDGGAAERSVAWFVGACVAGTAYTSLFLALASVWRHAVVAGLLFVLLWEGLLGSLLSGVASLSVVQWGAEVAHAVSSAVGSDPDIPLWWAALASALLVAGGIWFTGDRLRSYTLRGDE